MARHARGLSGELRGKIDIAADAGPDQPDGGRAAGRRPRGPGDRTVHLVGHPGRRVRRLPEHPAHRRPARHPDRRGHGLRLLQGRAEDQPGQVLQVHRHHPDRRRRRRAVVRRARPPGGRHPPGPEQPRLRREQPDPAVLLVRHLAQGHHQLLPRHHLARGRRLAAVRRPDDDGLPAEDPVAPASPPPTHRQPSRRAPTDRKARPREPTDDCSLRCHPAGTALRLQPHPVQGAVQPRAARAPSTSSRQPTSAT